MFDKDTAVKSVLGVGQPTKRIMRSYPIDEDLVRRLKVLAADRREKVADLVNNSIRMGIDKIPAQQIMELESEPELHKITKTITVSISEKMWVEFGALVNLQKVNKGTAAVNAISDYVDKYRSLFDSLNIKGRG